VQTSGAVLIQSEWNREARVVRMNARHNPAVLSSWSAILSGGGRATHSWWRHVTSPATSGLRYTAGIYFVVSPATVVTERFTRTAADELTYEFSVTDPTWYTATWKGRNRLRRSNEPILEFACHEGNYAVRFILQGMRAQEAAAHSEPSQ
jgi:hypothetical protein